jgi:hypothetical protein
MFPLSFDVLLFKLTCNMTKYLIFLLLAIGLVACEKETYVNYWVENKTAAPIRVTDSQRTPAIYDTIIPANTTVICHWRIRGKTTNAFNPATTFGNSLFITNANGDTLKKDYKKITNWYTDVKTTSGTATHQYTLTVNDADF